MCADKKRLFYWEVSIVCKFLLVVLCVIFAIACTGNVSDCIADAENESLAGNDSSHCDPDDEYVILGGPGTFRLVDVPDNIVSFFDELEPAIKTVLERHNLEVEKVREQGSVGGCWNPCGNFSRTYMIRVSENVNLTVGLSSTATGFNDIWVLHEGVVQNAENRFEAIDLDLVTDLFNSLSTAPVTTDELNEFLQSSIRDDWDDRVGYWNEYPCDECCYELDDWGIPGSLFMEYHFGAAGADYYTEMLNITSSIRR